MYMYCRIQQDLNSLGEVIRFHDLALVKALRKWIRKNFSSIARAEDLYPENPAQIWANCYISRN